MVLLVVDAQNGIVDERLYEFSRRNIPMEGVTHLSVDVTDEDAVNACLLYTSRCV